LFYLLGKNLLREVKVLDSDIVTPQELESKLGINRKVCIARLHELKGDGLVEIPSKGRYRIVMARARDWIDEIRGG
jgi:ribosomal protein S25